MAENDWALVDKEGELITSSKRKISLENQAESLKVFVDERSRNETGSHNNSPGEFKTENNEASAKFEQNPGVEDRNPERNNANSGQSPSESLSAVSENPAIEILKLVRHGIRLEAIPKHIDNFIDSLENYKKTQPVPSAHHLKKVIDKANEMDNEIDEKLFPLRNTYATRICSWVKRNYQKSWNPFNNSPALMEENYHQSHIQQQSTPSILSRDAFVLPNGKKPTLFWLTKNITSDLDQLINNFTLTMKLSHKLDRAIFELMGLRLYSVEFVNLCEFCKNGDPDNEEFQGLPDSLHSFHRKNISEVMRDSNIVEKLKKLSGILDHDFYKKVAFSFVNEVFLKYPQDYSNVYEETYLESLQKACHLLHIIEASERANSIQSIDIIDIQKGIIEMEGVIHKMDFISGSSSSD